jgi:cell division protease FtsH
MSLGDQLAWQVLVNHFGADRVNSIASSRRRFASHLLPDLQAAIIAEIAPFNAVLSGVHQPHEFQALTLSGLLIRDGHSVVSITPLQYQDMDVGEDEPFTALNNGLWLFQLKDTPVAVLLSHYEDHFGRSRLAQVEIAYLPRDEASQFARGFLQRVQRAGEESRLYRGKVLSFESGSDYSGMRADMLVHSLPRVERSDVILGERTMVRLDQHVFEFERHRAALKRLGQSTRKGVLLYGPPGTGKTHVIRYISSTLSDHTTVLITAEQVRNLSKYMTLARTLQPSIVVLEDVDLIGRSREGMNSPNTEVLLNRLLNEMDGLRADADILFILTTNRPEDIEDALASRPGRVDEAIEVPLPDDVCRERLIALYGRALAFEDGAVAEAVSRSAGASAAFMKEMVRRLAQNSIARDGGSKVLRQDVASVFGDVVSNPSSISRRIVGMTETPIRTPLEDTCF